MKQIKTWHKGRQVRRMIDDMVECGSCAMVFSVTWVGPSVPPTYCPFCGDELEFKTPGRLVE